MLDGSCTDMPASNTSGKLLWCGSLGSAHLSSRKYKKPSVRWCSNTSDLDAPTSDLDAPTSSSDAKSRCWIVKGTRPGGPRPAGPPDDKVTRPAGVDDPATCPKRAPKLA